MLLQNEAANGRLFLRFLSAYLEVVARIAKVSSWRTVVSLTNETLVFMNVGWPCAQRNTLYRFLIERLPTKRRTI